MQDEENSTVVAMAVQPTLRGTVVKRGNDCVTHSKENSTVKATAVQLTVRRTAQKGQWVYNTS